MLPWAGDNSLTVVLASCMGLNHLREPVIPPGHAMPPMHASVRAAWKSGVTRAGLLRRLPKGRCRSAWLSSPNWL